MDADSAIDEVADPDPCELLASADADDRAFGAFLLAGADHTTEVHLMLKRCLNDASPDVVSYAAQSLALHGDVPALDALLPILEAQPGQDVNPIPWATAVLASNSDEATQDRVRQALLRLRGRGSPEVVRQVDILLGPN